MKITHIQVDVVSVPRARSNTSGLKKSQATGEFGIIRIHTDAGITGLGEVTTIWDNGAKPLCREIREFVGPALAGKDPRQITQISQEVRAMFQWSRHASCAVAGIEMALYDITGKALDTPVYTLLGGRVRDSVELSMSVFINPVDVMVAHAQEYVEQGFSTVKVKVGRNARHELEALEAIRKRLGDDVTIRIDANMAWFSLKEAISFIRRLESLGVHSIEQPLPPGRYQDMADLRRCVDVPIMVDEDLWSVEDALRLMDARAADIFNVYVSESGGITEAKMLLDLGERIGVLGAIGSMPELGIGTAAQLHLALSTPNVVVPSDVCGFRYSIDDLITEPLQIENGHILPPSGSGLGVELDEDALKRYGEAY